MVVVVSRLSEGVVGARGDGTMEPMAIRVACLHIGDAGAVEREVEAVLALGVSDRSGVGIARTESDW